MFKSKSDRAWDIWHKSVFKDYFEIFTANEDFCDSVLLLRIFHFDLHGRFHVFKTISDTKGFGLESKTFDDFWRTEFASNELHVNKKSENLIQASHSIKIKKQLIATRKTYKKQIIKLSRKCTKLF